MFLRILRGSEHLSRNSLVHWGTWLGCTGGTAFISYIVASAIPNFGSLVALIGATFGTILCFQPYGIMWLYDNWTPRKEERDWRWWVMVFWSIFVIAAGCFAMVGGTYGAVVGLIADYSGAEGASSWSCADNSNST